MAPDGWIKWRTSRARIIILDDLETGLLPADATVMSAEEAWEICYSHMAEFVDVVFSQFQARLKDHRRRAGEQMSRAAFESNALAHDRRLFPRATENSHGEPVFDLSPAKLLLQADVADKKHEEMTPSELQQTRNEYKIFKARIFKEKIYQTVRREKFINYLEMKRAQAQEAAG
jgi:hypothetical protein